MTPQREQYLAKCSKRERELRRCMSEWKKTIRFYKYPLTIGLTFTVEDAEYRKESIRCAKYHLSTYRHELARLKGMGRVVVPKLLETSNGIFIYKKYECVCSEWIDETCRYCPSCGRRILWEKVK